MYAIAYVRQVIRAGVARVQIRVMLLIFARVSIAGMKNLPGICLLFVVLTASLPATALSAVDRENGSQVCDMTIDATVRDFQIEHPDFQYVVGVDPGIVEQELGSDDRPVYAGDSTTPTTTGQANFDQWYNDVDNFNLTFSVPIELAETQPGLYTYETNAFFPIDDQGWGNEGNAHNYHFTTTFNVRFRYQGGEVFSFEGDDDVWVFVNRKLAIDIGGVHGPLSASIDMDAMASSLGLEVGNEYDIHFFHAERFTSQSNFNLSTSINCLNPREDPLFSDDFEAVD